MTRCLSALGTPPNKVEVLVVSSQHLQQLGYGCTSPVKGIWVGHQQHLLQMRILKIHRCRVTDRIKWINSSKVLSTVPGPVSISKGQILQAMVGGLDCVRDPSGGCMRKQLGDRQEAGIQPVVRKLS